MAQATAILPSVADNRLTRDMMDIAHDQLRKYPRWPGFYWGRSALDLRRRLTTSEVDLIVCSPQLLAGFSDLFKVPLQPSRLFFSISLLAAKGCLMALNNAGT